MKNKGLLIKQKIAMRNKKLTTINSELEALMKRSEEVESAIEAVETEEDLNDVETQIEEIQSESASKKQEKENLEKEISELETELKELEEKEPEKENKRNMENINKVETRKALNDYIRTKGEKREGLKIVDGGALIPVEVLKPQLQKTRNVDLSKLVRVVKVNSASGKYAVISKSKNKMNTVEELEKNPELGKPKVTPIDWSVKTYRGQLSVSQEMIDDATYDIMGLVEEDAANQDVNTKNYAIAEIFKTAKPESASGFDGLKDIINKKVSSVYDVILVVTDSMFAALDKVKDKEGRYMLQPDPTSPTGYKFKNKIIFPIPDELLGSEGEMKAFIGDAFEFVTLFDRTQTTVRWTPHELYGEILGLFSRFDTKATDKDSGVFVTYTDAV
ncbi:phage major capsid protein [uncultured Granulicatella sp.]|uniref:phage major capsid protein n=1 Tax=uncultured Granulicatella sp. TaxID=316089 RepID=UPI0026037D05|nr:phage major capsid protein [uncultured Granulicatella sp.]